VTLLIRTQRARYDAAVPNSGCRRSPYLLLLLRTAIALLAAAGSFCATAAQPQARAATPAAATALRGVTVSAAQHPGGAAIAWSKVAAAGYRFAAIEGTRGTDYANPYYAADSAAAVDAGLDVAPYAIAIPNTTDATQAADDAVEFTAYRSGPSMLPVVLVLENDPNVASDHANACYGLDAAVMDAWISNFESRVNQTTDQFPIVSTTAAWWHSCTGDSTLIADGPLWLAGTAMTLPAGATTWYFRQYNSTGTVPGIVPAGGTTLSYFNLSNVLPIDPGAQYSAGAGANASVQIDSMNAKAGQVLSYSATGLPPGLTINGSGLISGVIGTLVSSPGQYDPVVTATSASSGASGGVVFGWLINELGPPTVTKAPTQHLFTVGSSMVVEGFSSAASFGFPAFTARGLPPGLTIDPWMWGFVSGWPTTPGTYHVSVTLGPSFGQADTTTVKLTWLVRAAPGSGPRGRVVLDVGGRCLDDPSGRTASGTRVDIATCTGKPSQAWTMAQDDTIRVSGRCLAEAGVGSGAWVVLQACTQRTAQRWQFAAMGELVNTESGRCLTDPRGRTASGTRLDVEACAGRTSQRWTGPAAQIASQFGGYCLDDPGGRTVNGTALDFQPCTGRANQKWTAEPDGTIRFAGRCMQAGSPAVLHSCTGSAAQRWSIVRQSQFGSELTDSAGACLGTSASSARGTMVLVHRCTPWQLEDFGILWHVL
jgi:GH25 family lysozyme M1 (1,4-beta-N-acetylmuramidase)